MVKVDLSKVNFSRKDEKEQEADDPLLIQRMRLEEAKWRALGGAGGEQDNDPIDREVSKALRDLRIKSTMRALRSTGDGDDEMESSALKEIREELRRTKEELQDMKRQKEQAEQDAKWQKQLDDLKSLIMMQSNATGKKDEITPWQQKLQDQLDVMEKEREKEREERRKEKEERESLERKKELDALREDIEDRYANIEAMLRESGGSKNRGIVAEAKRIAEEQAAMRQVMKSMGLIPAGEADKAGEKMSVDEIIDSIASNGDKLVKTGTSIYNSLKKGENEYEYDIGPREKISEFAVEPRSTSPPPTNMAETYVQEGHEITNHPDFPGTPVWVGKYGDFYLSDDGNTPLDKKAMELAARTRQDEMLANIEAAKKAYMEAMQKRETQPMAPEARMPDSMNQEDDTEDDMEEYATVEASGEESDSTPEEPAPDPDEERRQRNLANLEKAREAKRKKAEEKTEE